MPRHVLKDITPGVRASDFLKPVPCDTMKRIQKRYMAVILPAFIVFIGGIFVCIYGMYRGWKCDSVYSVSIQKDRILMATTRDVSQWSRDGRRQWSHAISGGGILQAMPDMDTNASDTVFVANTDDKIITTLDTGGKEKRSIGEDLGTEFWLTVLGNGNIAVSDTDANKLRILSPNGLELQDSGQEGIGNGQFHFPSDIAQLPDGTILVADTDNVRLQLFDENLKYKGQWNFSKYILDMKGGKAPLKFKSELDITLKQIGHFPISLYVDEDRERVYVGFESIYNKLRSTGHIGVFDFQGRFLGHRRPRLSNSKPFASFRMGPGENGKIALTDPNRGAAGLWDPDGDAVVPFEQSGVRGFIDSRIKKIRLAKTMLFGGGGMFALGLFAVFVVLIIGTKTIRKEYAAEKSNDPLRLDFVKRHLLPDASQTVNQRMDSTKKFKLDRGSVTLIVAITLMIILIIGSLALYFLFPFTDEMNTYSVLITLILDLVLMIIITSVVLRVDKPQIITRSMDGLLTGTLDFFFDELNQRLAPDEIVCDAVLVAGNDYLRDVVALTDRRLLHLVWQKPLTAMLSMLLLKANAPNTRYDPITLPPDTPLTDIQSMRYSHPKGVMRLGGAGPVIIITTVHGNSVELGKSTAKRTTEFAKRMSTLTGREILNLKL